MINYDEIQITSFDGTRRGKNLLWHGFDDMKLVIRGNEVKKVITRIVDNNKYYCLLRVNKLQSESLRFDQIRSLGMEIIPEEGKGDTDTYRCFLYTYTVDFWEGHKEKRVILPEMKRFRVITDECEGDLNRISKKKLIEFAQGGMLYYRVAFMYGGSANQEPCLNRNFLDRRMDMHDRNKRYYFVDDTVDVKIFLKSCESGRNKEKHTVPIDVRKLDINQRLLEELRGIKGMYYKDAFTLEYEMESPYAAAQYFVTEFDSNRKWDANPFNFMNYRISAYLMPDNPQTAKMDVELDKLVVDIENGDKYLVDSIYLNSDISYNTEMACGWIECCYGLAHWD